MPLSTTLLALDRVLPIVVFLLAVTVMTEICQRVGVFDVVGHWIARRGRHRLWLLWLLFALFAVICTVFLSLDTTAVLLTPVALAIAQQIGVPPRLFALTTLWIANTGSLILPVSNLTNLLALDRFEDLGLGHGDYVRLALLPGLAAVAATLVLILALHPHLVTTRYGVEPPAAPHDPVLFRLGLGVCLVVGPAFAVGLPPWAVASVAAAVLATATGMRAPRLLRELSAPWLMAAGFVVLTLVVSWAEAAGALDELVAVLGTGTGRWDLLQVAGAAALASNAVNNLLAYLAVEPFVSDHPTRLFAALIGANAGPLVTPWGSLATLLWLQRCRAAGVRWRLGRLALAGLVCAAVSVGAATLTLAAMA